MWIFRSGEDMFDDFEPFVIMAYLVAGAEEIIDLLVWELIIDDFFENYVASFVGEIDPTWVYYSILFGRLGFEHLRACQIFEVGAAWAVASFDGGGLVFKEYAFVGTHFYGVFGGAGQLRQP